MDRSLVRACPSTLKSSPARTTTDNNYSPVIWLGWLEIRFGSAFGKRRSVGEPPRTPRGSAGQGRPQLPSHCRHRQGWPARPKASRLPPPPWVLLSPEAIRAHRAREIPSHWPSKLVGVVDPPLSLSRPCRVVGWPRSARRRRAPRGGGHADSSTPPIYATRWRLGTEAGGQPPTFYRSAGGPRRRSGANFTWCAEFPEHSVP